ncbi:hypothetical protein [Actinopolyspora mortivallis]|uniref:hypothetical protein n=1 Tax=Actinopolyspora mortivallis TaxID=33906 RepID=UPI00036235C3|nr:hypothetical protein [Actinopolyspora mortivallis]
MNGRNSRLAVLLLRCQWMLEEAAYELGSDRLSTSERGELATALTELARALHEPDGTRQSQEDSTHTEGERDRIREGVHA